MGAQGFSGQSHWTACSEGCRGPGTPSNASGMRMCQTWSCPVLLTGARLSLWTWWGVGRHRCGEFCSDRH